MSVVVLSRRRLLAAAATLAAAMTSWGAWRIFGPATPPAPAFPDGASEALAAPVMATLLAAVEAAIGFPADRAHYEEYFRWRAEHLRGYTILYRRFAATLDGEARRLTRQSYAAGAAEVQRRILAVARQAPPRASLWDRVRARASDPSWPLYDRYVLGEALALFARTDAWVRLGYSAWPGTPRGLDRYRRPPA